MPIHSLIFHLHRLFLPVILTGALIVTDCPVIAQGASPYYSRNAGFLEQNGTWSRAGHAGANCACNPGCSMTGSKTVFIKHSVESTCDPFEIYGNANFHVKDGGSLVINGNLEIFGNAFLEIDSTSSVTVNGDLTVSGNGEVELLGLLNVTGNVDVSGSGYVCGSGTASIAGSISGSGWCYSVSVLPIELISFTASLMEDQSVKLLWQTASEIDNDHFTIERSTDGMTFTEIGEMKGYGNSNKKLSYVFYDKTARAGTFYYRLTQTDLDGKQEHFKTVVLTIADDAESNLCTLEIIPNPCVPWCEARLTDCPEGNFRANLMDANGNIISELIPEFDSYNGIRYHINKQNFLMPGVYIINASNEKTRLSKKAIVK